MGPQRYPARLLAINWSYISAFFDGEGAIGVSAMLGSNVLSLRVKICQKSLEVLRGIRSFLNLSGIYSIIYRFATGMYSLEVGRVDDVMRFLRSVNSVVKRRQVHAALEYLEGRITGNVPLQILEEERMKHKRKASPLRTLGLRFPMTRIDAIKAAAVKSTQARDEGTRTSFLERIEERTLSLPHRFDVNNIQRVIGVSRPRAQVLGRLMEREGLVRSHFEKGPPRFRKLVFERL